jgi:hypothetical protein
MTSNQMVGKTMADLGMDILLKGKLPEDRMNTISVSEYIFDWRELKRWGIDLHSLPAGSRVEFREFTVWEIYKWHILGVITLFILQVIFIGGLMVSRKKRKQVEVNLQKSEALLNAAQHLTKLGGWEYHFEKSRLTWIDEVYRIHELSPDSFDPNDVRQNIEFYESRDRDVIVQAFNKAVNQGEPYDHGELVLK